MKNNTILIVLSILLPPAISFALNGLLVAYKDTANIINCQSSGTVSGLTMQAVLSAEI